MTAQGICIADMSAHVLFRGGQLSLPLNTSIDGICPFAPFFTEQIAGTNHRLRVRLNSTVQHTRATTQLQLPPQSKACEGTFQAATPPQDTLFLLRFAGSPSYHRNHAAHAAIGEHQELGSAAPRRHHGGRAQTP